MYLIAATDILGRSARPVSISWFQALACPQVACRVLLAHSRKAHLGLAGRSVKDPEAQYT